MNLYSLSVLLFSFGVFLIAILAVAKSPDRLGLYFLVFSISVCGWGVLYSIWTSQGYSRETTLVLIRISEVFAVFIPITWLHFVFAFIQKKEPFRYFFALNYGATFVLACLAPTDFFFTGVHEIPIFHYYKTPGPLFYFFLALFFTIVPYAFILLVRAYRAASGQDKKQLGFLIGGLFVSFLGGSGTFLPVFGINHFLFLLCLMPVYPFLVGIPLIRFGLFDADRIAEIFRRDKLAAIGTLATSINHEIRNPLYIIQGLSQSYLANVEVGIFKSHQQALDKSNEIMRKTEIQATRAMQIMKSFALFAKQGIDHSHQPEKISISDVLENVLPLVNHELDLEKIELRHFVPPGLPPAIVDARHIEEIFFNLIVNACQAIKGAEKAASLSPLAAGEKRKVKSPDAGYGSEGVSECGSEEINRAPRFDREEIHSGTPIPRNSDTGIDSALGQIVISASQQNGHINITIRDNGPGIPAGQLKRIFEPFFTTKSEGTGLGLYITKQLVERNGGKIAVESKSGVGTAFSLSFSTHKNQ